MPTLLNGFRKFPVTRTLFGLAGLLFLFLACQFSPFSQKLEVGTVGARSFLANFGNPNPDGSRTFPQAPGNAYLNLYRVSSPAQLSLQVRALGQNDQKNPSVTLLVYADGRELGMVTVGSSVQTVSFALDQLAFGPQDLTVLLRLKPDGNQGNALPQLALYTINLQPNPQRTGPTVPPLFHPGWWLLVALWPWLLIRLFKLAVPAWCGNLLFLLNLGLIAWQLIEPSSAAFLHTNWLVAGLDLILVNTVAGLTWQTARSQGRVNGSVGIEPQTTSGEKPGTEAGTGASAKGKAVTPEKGVQKSELGPVFLLLLGLGCLYLATARGYLLSPDELLVQGVTAALLKGNPFQPLTAFLPALTSPPLYSKYGIGLSIVGAPFYYLGAWVTNLFPYWYNQRNGSFGVVAYFLLLTELVFTVGAAGLFYWLLRLLKISARIALLCATLYGVATMTWHYARTFFSEPLVTFCLLLALVAVLKYRARGNWRWAGLMGFALGLAVATRLVNVTILPLFGLVTVWLAWQMHRPTRSASPSFQADQPRFKTLYQVYGPLVLPIAAWTIGVGLWLGVVAIYNYARFHSFVATGYEEGFTGTFWEGFYGLVFSPGKSLFLYNPILLLGLLGLWKAFKRNRFFAGLSVLVVAIYLGTYSAWNDWGGGGVWGPRFLLPIIPLLLWPAAYCFEWVGQIGSILGGKGLRATSALVVIRVLGGIFLLLVCVVSFFIQFLSVVVDFHIYLGIVGHDPATLQASVYNLADSPIVGQWNLWLQDARGDMASYFYFETSFARFVRTVHDAGFSLALLFFVATLYKAFETPTKQLTTGAEAGPVEREGAQPVQAV